MARGWLAAASCGMVLQDGEVDTQELRYGDEVVLSESATLALLRSSPGIGSYLYADELAPDVPARGTTRNL